MSTPTFTRADVDRAEPLDFDKTRQEKPVSITIEAGPTGLTVRVDYQGTLGSIPAAIERLRAAGVLELVSAGKPATAPKGKNTKVQPEYNAGGDPICPTHKKPLREGKYGLYCPAKDDSQERGYCSIKFVS